MLRYASGAVTRRRAILAVLFFSALLVVSLTSRSRQKSPFILDPAVWADGGPSPVERGLSFPDSTHHSRRWGQKVPNIVHFVILAGKDGTSQLSYWQYLSIRSALVVQRPEVLYM